MGQKIGYVIVVAVMLCTPGFAEQTYNQNTGKFEEHLSHEEAVQALPILQYLRDKKVRERSEWTESDCATVQSVRFDVCKELELYCGPHPCDKFY